MIIDMDDPSAHAYCVVRGGKNAMNAKHSKMI